MDPDELYEAIVKTSGARSAIAALLLANDHTGARQRAQQMNREDLISLVLLSAHEYMGGYLTALEGQLEQQGKGPEQARREAREMAMLHFRTEAQMWSVRFGQQAGDGGE
jgi:hypothetical protein